LEVVEPGFGLVIVIGTLPACAVVAVPVATASVKDVTNVVSGVPPKFTTAPGANPFPFTVIMNAPTPMLLGLREVIVGIGFTSVIVTLAFFVGSATLVPFTVNVFGLGTCGGEI